MQQRGYQTKMQDVDYWQCMIDVKAGMQQSVIDDAIAVDQWRRRLHNCMRARGGHFEWYSLKVS